MVMSPVVVFCVVKSLIYIIFPVSLISKYFSNFISNICVAFVVYIVFDWCVFDWRQCLMFIFVYVYGIERYLHNE